MGTPAKADAVCEGGDLDCGSGLLLIIREAFEPLARGGILEVRSSEISVKEDLPAWCRMVGHRIVDVRPGIGRSTSYFVAKDGADANLSGDLERAREFRWQVRAAQQADATTRVFARNHMLSIGQPASFDTADSAPSAVEVLLAALAAECVAGVRWRASRQSVEFDALECSLSARANDARVALGLSDDGPAGLAAIEGRLYAQGDFDGAALDAWLADTLARSLIAATLAKGCRLSVEAKQIP